MSTKGFKRMGFYCRLYLNKLIASFAGICTTMVLVLHTTVQAQAPGGPDKGEFDKRVAMALDRLTGRSYQPFFTEDFVLADVNINKDNPRRFYNFSGDLSGRYIEVIAMTDKEKLNFSLPAMVSKLIACQRSDGRYGDPLLQFSEEKIGAPQMAMLWGNGRLLVGLVTYYKYYHDQRALNSAKKLGDFYLSVWRSCIKPGVMKRVEDAGATGIICLTQYIEGLVLLTEATGDEKYAAIATEVYPYLPPRGNQHTHGYLTTLRGVLLLYQHSHQKEQLEFVRKNYEDLINSDDLTQFGSVREYFGHEKTERDEGCSTADFIRLSFDLYRQTGDRRYIDLGEFALYNGLYFNQYYTGDFGHHLISNSGSTPDYLHAAWWCCTMHGLRALYDLREHDMVEYDGGYYKIALYLETTFYDNRVTLSLSRGPVGNDHHFYRIIIGRRDRKSDAFVLRLPPWAVDPVLKLNGKPLDFKVSNGQLFPGQKLKDADTLEVGFKYQFKVIMADKEQINVGAIQSKVKGSIIYGPNLLCVDDKTDPVYTAEPNSNIVYTTTFNAGRRGLHSDSWEVFYTHAGYPSYARTLLKPIADLTFSKHGYVLTNFLLAPVRDKNQFEQDNSMIEPWREKQN